MSRTTAHQYESALIARARALLHGAQRLIQGVMDWLHDDGPQLGASIAFYSLFALAPLLVVVIAIAGAFFGAEAVRGQVMQQLSGLLGQEAAAGVQAMIASAWRSDQSTLASLLGIGTLLVGATGVMVEMRRALNVMLHEPEPDGDGAVGAISALLRARLAALALVMSFGFLLIASLMLSAGIAALGAYLSQRFTGAGALLGALDWFVSLTVLSLAFAALLRGLPYRAPRWPVIWTGAAISALLFTLGKSLVALYLAHASVASSFGAAGSLVIVIIWIYFTAQVVLLGAATGRAIHTRNAAPGSVRPPPPVSQPALQPTRIRH